MMVVHLDLYIPLIAAFIYVIAALILKRSMQLGAGSLRVIFITNWMYVLVFIPFLIGGVTIHAVNLNAYIWPFLTGVALFAGQLFAFKAIQIGDISIQAPVMGTKVVLVAVFTVLVGSVHVPPLIWIASAITVVALYLLTYAPAAIRARTHVAKTIVLALSAASSFGISEVLIEKEAAAFGEMPFLFLSMVVCAALSLGLIPLFEGPLLSIPKVARGLALWGSFLMAFEAAMLYASIAFYGGATQANIMYSSRGIWSILLIWSIGSWFANTEQAIMGKKIMVRRLLGAVLLSISIAGVLIS